MEAEAGKEHHEHHSTIIVLCICHGSLDVDPKLDSHDSHDIKWAAIRAIQSFTATYLRNSRKNSDTQIDISLD
jgi:hypothetical protein